MTNLYAQNCDGSIPPPKFSKPPSSESTGGTQKVKVGPKMVWACSIHMPSLAVICRCTAAREEKWVFFVGLFVTLTVCVSLGYRHTHCEVYIFAIYRSILMHFSAFLEEETPCRNCQKYLNYITRWHHICLGIRSKFERQSLCT